jgi:ElaB/YqjD/DUF883 family membrane-anchored ribosome-binding protein
MNQTTASLEALHASGQKLSQDIAAVAGDATTVLQQAGRESQAVQRERVGQAAASAQRQVELHPWALAGACGVLGLALGLLLARR